jgi:hypothetical protein
MSGTATSLAAVVRRELDRAAAACDAASALERVALGLLLAAGAFRFLPTIFWIKTT